uniref:phenylalanine--tRNA ligase n=1 Tax=Elaeis guineensis var. tenera TaxID=51953 RepID=A0A8N4IAU1_ELAGV|nr:phenylalanine--tRNA ligase beta subunit, cytoplasmic isoform X2 [Elaeis guineensis]
MPPCRRNPTTIRPPPITMTTRQSPLSPRQRRFLRRGRRLCSSSSSPPPPPPPPTLSNPTSPFLSLCVQIAAMPTVSVGRDRLFEALGETYTQEDFEKLCFEFGIELDDVTTEKAIIRKERHLEGEEEDEDEEVIYKIEVAANRYDLLCLEGIVRALRIFIGKEEIPVFKVSDVPPKSMLKMHVKPETALIRPFVVCAVLRGITFDEARYNSFIDLQDKLHQNICRKRSLVAIGTHDLDTIQGPFSYEALPPPDINFVPLKQVKSFRAGELLEFYRSDMKLKKFLHIIENSPVYPVIYDSNRTVLSLPPIINGAHSAITLKTKNVFIECTATDLTKANIVLNTMVTMFSEYCGKKFEVEPVEVVYSDGRSSIYPDLTVSNMEVSLADITGPIGIALEASEVVPLLNKMQLQAGKSLTTNGNCNIIVSVPPTRSDILHARDVMEDVAIAYGFNNIPKSKPKCMTTGGRQPLNRFSDKIRAEVSRAGYMEVLTWVLCSHEENFAMLKRNDDGDKAVIIANPRSSDFEVVRTSLMSCLLKTVKHNIDHPRPIKIFEVGDVVILDAARDVGAANNRRLAALYCNVTSGFEVLFWWMTNQRMGSQEESMSMDAALYLRKDLNTYFH